MQRSHRAGMMEVCYHKSCYRCWRVLVPFVSLPHKKSWSNSQENICPMVQGRRRPITHWQPGSTLARPKREMTNMSFISQSFATSTVFTGLDFTGSVNRSGLLLGHKCLWWRLKRGKIGHRNLIYFCSLLDLSAHGLILCLFFTLTEAEQ